MSKGKVFNIFLKLLATIVLIGLCLVLLLVLIYSIFDVEFIDGKLYAGKPIVNDIRLGGFLFAAIFVWLIMATGYFTFTREGKGSTIAIFILIDLVVIFLSLPNLVTYHGRGYCDRLESYPEYIAHGIVEYYKNHPVAKDLPDILKVVDKIPPSFTFDICGDPNGTIAIVVTGIKGRCPFLDSVTKHIEIKNDGSISVLP